MKLDEKIPSRLDGLINEGEEISKIGTNRTTFIREPHFDVERSSSWHTKSLNLLARVFQKESEHYQKLKSLDENIFLVTNFQRALGILKSSKDDYENGYLFDTRALIEAEVFDDFIEQAEHLLTQGYFVASAVILGSVLEDGMRKLCAKNGITLSAKPKLGVMNDDLAKAGVYNSLKQKQITAL